MEATPKPKTIKITGAFLGMVEAILEDAHAHRAAWLDDGSPNERLSDGRPVDDLLLGLARVGDGLEHTKGGATVTLDDAGLEALRAEAEYRIEWALDEAGAEYGAEALRWHSKARSAKAALAKIVEAQAKTERRTWRSMSDLHIDITEALEYLVGRFGTLNEKDIQGVADYLGIDLALVQGVAEEMGVSS